MIYYSIRPINTGFVANNPMQYHYHPSTHGFHKELKNQREDFPVFAFLVEGNGKKILVDTGMCDSERANKYHHPGSHQEKGQAIFEQLASIGISEQEIDTVILTHLHWDHASYLDHFKNAVFYVNEKELEFAEHPIPLYYKSYEAPELNIISSFANIKFQKCYGEMEIFDGICVFETPGHSPGHMSVEVRTETGKYIIGGDCAFRLENFKPIPELHYDITPPGRFYNILETWRSLERVKNRAVDLEHILLTHESGLLEIIKTRPVLGKISVTAEALPAYDMAGGNESGTDLAVCKAGTSDPDPCVIFPGQGDTQNRKSG